MAKKLNSKASNDIDTPNAVGGKGRPTRTRKEAEAARLRPLVPNDRKEAKRIERQKRDEAWARQNEALKTGDERYLPVRDKGKVRRYVRSWIDARWSISEFLLPAMIIFLAGMILLSFIPTSDRVSGASIWFMTLFFYGLLFVSVFEGLIVWFRLKKRIKKEIPKEDIPKGTWFYSYSRMIMVRPLRSPRVQTHRGDFPGNKQK